MSAGQSLRRQNYAFATTVTPVPRSRTHSRTIHRMRVIVAVVSAVAVDVATFATISMLIAGR